MINIEQELELGPNCEYEIQSVKMHGDDQIEVTAKAPYYSSIYTWYFNAKTGVIVGGEDSNNPMRLRPKSKQRPVAHFYLFAGHRDWSKDGWVKLLSEKHPDGATAATKSKEYNLLASTSLSPFRFMVKREIEETTVRDYPEWAAFRFETGDWVAPAWATEEWSKTEETKFHYAHLSKNDDCQIAFYESEYNAQCDAVSVMAPGRYLQRYYSHILDATKIRDWAVKVDIEATLKFTTDPDEIVRIYTTQGAPSSCMTYKESDWATKIHPARVYGAPGDTGLAYLERRGKIVARALVNMANKVAGRRYGDIERLTDQLLAEGWTLDAEDSSACGRGEGGFEGARLNKIELEDDPGNYVMPYIDAGYGVSDGEDDEDGNKFWVMSKNYEYSATSTEGTLSSYAHSYEYHCADCGEGMHEDDYYYVENADDPYFCGECVNEHSFCCRRCDSRYIRSRCREVDGRDYCRSCADYIGAVQCDAPGCSTWTDSPYTVSGQDYCSPCHSNHAVSCDYCGDDFLREDLRTIYDARYEAEDGPDDQHADACDNCVNNDDRIVRDINDNWIDTETATQCPNEDCGVYFSGSLDETECPRCQPASNENTQTEEVIAA